MTIEREVLDRLLAGMIPRIFSARTGFWMS